MTTLRIANDIHVFGPHEIVGPNDLALNYQNYLLGDIVDFANVEKDRIKEAQTMFAYLVNLYDGAYIMGNHELWKDKELDGVPTPDYIVIHDSNNPTLLCHGHVPIWGKKKVEKWMDKEIGAGKLRRFFSCLFNKYRDEYGGFDLSEDEVENIYHYTVKHGCRTIVLGHMHPKETIHFRVKGINVVVLKRGFNEVEI